MADATTIKYSIVGLKEATGTIAVKFYTDLFTDGLIYDVDLPVSGGATLKGAELDAHIRGFCPIGQLSDEEARQAWRNKRADELKSVDFSHIKEMLPARPEPLPNGTLSQPVVTGAQSL